MKVDLPEPLEPKIPTLSPFNTERFKLLKEKP